MDIRYMSTLIIHRYLEGGRGSMLFDVIIIPSILPGA